MENTHSSASPSPSSSSPVPPAEILAAAAQAYRPKLLAAAERILSDAGEAEDAVQDAMVAALRSLDRFRGESQVSSWLYRITINCALMRLRARRRRPATPIDELSFAEAELPETDVLLADEQLMFREEYAALAGALDGLAESQRDALLLRGVHELSIPEVARRLGRTANAAKMLVHRARENVRETLALNEAA
jgi:RNA polymerase sigma-70 factor (ECF subfamily)